MATKPSQLSPVQCPQQQRRVLSTSGVSSQSMNSVAFSQECRIHTESATQSSTPHRPTLSRSIARDAKLVEQNVADASCHVKLRFQPLPSQVIVEMGGIDARRLQNTRSLCANRAATGREAILAPLAPRHGLKGRGW